MRCNAEGTVTCVCPLRRYSCHSPQMFQAHSGSSSSSAAARTRLNITCDPSEQHGYLGGLGGWNEEGGDRSGEGEEEERRVRRSLVLPPMGWSVQAYNFRE